MQKLGRLADYGQSYWLDDLTRRMIRNGELKRRVAQEGLRGVTSNPAIFQKAITGSRDYDAQLRKLAGEAVSVPGIYEALVISDVQDACDILAPVYRATDGVDGYVSLEVSPLLAYNAEESLSEARRLSSAVGRPNLLIKIPGTREALPAIQQALLEGININITLLFSQSGYEAVAEAYLRALEGRLSEGKSLRTVASVASFFVSRIDVLIDALLSERWNRSWSVERRSTVAGLFGQAGIANAKLAYQLFRRITASERWVRLREKGARAQRLLWASTSTKDPLYRDVRYVESLIGNDTVNTMPEETAEAFARHGTLTPNSLESGLERATEVLNELARVGIDFEQQTARLQEEGVRKFIEPFDKLMAGLCQKRLDFLAKRMNRQRLPETLKSQTRVAAEALDTRRFVTRLYQKDGTLWSLDPEVAKSIQNRMGWLDAPQEFLGRANEIVSFAEEVRREGFRQTVLLGMGGSSLSPEVCAQTFGAARGWPDLVVLDNTDPAAVAHVAAQVDAQNTLFIVPSKSGTTLETLSFYRYFYDLVAARNANPGRSFAAITDPGTWLAKEAVAKKFRHCFLNPADIGGRYSALSYFGLVPMALLGIDVRAFLKRASKLQLSAGPGVPAIASPPVELGALLATQARKGRGKATFIMSPTIEAFARWAEQLIAESTGKSGQGILPVVDEPVGPPRVYGDDRLFIYISRSSRDNKAVEKRVSALERAGLPVVRISLPDRTGLAEEFVRWEIATATAGAILGVNPFDEPDVAESKRNTSDLLAQWRERNGFEEEEPSAAGNGITVYGARTRKRVAPERAVASFLEKARAGDYVALLLYFRRTAARERLLEQLRSTLRDRFKVATTLGYGPRYLHSTGQLYKGGPNNGLFMLITTDSEGDVAIPGQPYTFSVLQQAQALGDLRAMRDRGRRVIRIHLKGELKSGLKKILDQVAGD